MTPPKSIRRIIIHNPFDRSQRTVEDLELTDGMTPLATFIEEKDGCQIITVVNGEVIPPGQRALRILRPNDSLVIAPVLQGGGGGGGKGILRMVAMIAVLAASILVPAFLVAGGALAAGGIGAALVGASIAIGGALIVNAILPATQPKAQQDTAIYGWNGPQMTARQGLVINKGYGIFGEAGNVISSYIYTAQDKQYMNLLISFGWGPGRSITQIKINDNPLENYKGVQVEKRLGFNEQDPVSFFRDVVNEFPQSTKVRVDGGPFTINGHGTDTEAVEVEVNFPKGLWAGPNSDGSYDPWTVFYKVEYSLHGSGVFTTALSPRTTADAGGTPQWLAIVQDQISGGPGNIIVVATSNNDDHHEGDPGPVVTTVTPFDPNGVVQANETRQFRSVWTRNHLNDPNNVASTPGAPVKTVTNWSQITDSVTGRATTIIRHVTRINLPSAGQWDIRITKLGSGQNTSVPTPHDNDSTRRGEEFWVTSIREFAHDALSYPNMILLGIRALATDQLSGSGINVTAVVDHGDPESLGYKHAIANDRPQAYYRLSETSGTVCTDSSGRGNNATYSATGITLQQPSLINQSANLAAAFNGAGTTKITTPSFAAGTDYCIEFWLNPTTYNGALLAGDGLGNGIFLDTATGKVNLFFGGVGHLSATVVPLHQVSHIAVVVKAGAAQFVINGKLDANTYGSLPSATFAVMLQSLNGVADEIALYVPSIITSRFVTHYRFGISERNKMEDFTGNQPATVDFDGRTNPLYGGGIDPDQYVDIDSFVDWANRCNELVDNGAGGVMFRHSFNGVFDTTGNLQDALDKVGVMGRARVLQVGGRKYTAIQDKPGTPVQMFGMGNIVRGSFKETWLALADRANSVDIQFSNSADSYKRDLVTVFDQAQIDSDGAVVPATTVDLFGAVTEAECWHQGSYQLASTKLLRRAVQFDADVEAIALVMGDLFYFSHDVPQWGQSGRIDGSTDASHVTLDQPVTMDPVKSYQLLCQLPTVKRYTGNITSITGLRVFISGWANTARVMRLKQGAVDVEITNSGLGFVDVASAAALSVASADLWDLDVIEILNVVNPADGLPHNALQTTAPFSAQPVQFDIYAFGELNNNVKTFRCSRLQRKTDQQFTIYGLEYNAAVYTDGTPILATGGDPKPVIDASNLVADETFDLVGERWQDYLRLGWRPGGLAVGADIYVSINGNVEKFYATVDSASSVLIKTTVGQTVLARVVGFDAKDNRANYNTAPTITRLMTGVTTNLLINSTFQNSLANWDINFRPGIDDVLRGVSDTEGFVLYQIVNANLLVAQKFLTQVGINPTKWAVGNYIMGSIYVQSGGGMTGHLALEIIFNGAGTTARAEWDLATATNGPTRVSTPAGTQVPVGTTSIDVDVKIRDAGSGVSVSIGKLIQVDHLLLEIVADASVSVPSKWADIDNGSNAQQTLGGSSTSLANQASNLQVVTGGFSVVVTDTTANISWTSLKIRYSFNNYFTNIQDSFYIITGLTGGLTYTAIPYYDIVSRGQIFFVEGKSNSHGSPAGAYDAVGADAGQAQIQDGRIPLGAVTFTTNNPGNTTPVTGAPSGGRNGNIGGGHPLAGT